MTWGAASNRTGGAGGAIAWAPFSTLPGAQCGRAALSIVETRSGGVLLAAGSLIFSSADGGRTWATQPQNFPAMDEVNTPFINKQCNS